MQSKNFQLANCFFIDSLNGILAFFPEKSTAFEEIPCHTTVNPDCYWAFRVYIPVRVSSAENREGNENTYKGRRAG